MRKILMALTSLIFMVGIISAVNAASPDTTYLRLDTTNGPLTGALAGPHYTSTVATGTQPYAATSTTLNTNLNADLWDGYHFDSYLNQAVKTTSSPVFLGLTVGTNTLFVDSVNNRLGINTSAPVYPLDCAGDINTSATYRMNGGIVLKQNAAESLFVGAGAGQYDAGEGWRNTFIGIGTGWSNTTGYANTFVGFIAGFHNTATGNVFVGYESGYLNTTGGSNAFLGGNAGVNNTSGSQNVFVGSGSGFYSTTAVANTFLGCNSGLYNTTGSWNVFVGLHAGGDNTTGSQNVYIGEEAGASSGTITSSIAIGCGTKVTADNQLVVGASDPRGLITDSYWGSGVTKTTPPSSFTFNATGGEGTDVSGADLKIAGGKGTGAAKGGKIILQTAPAGPAGETPNALVDRMTITSDGNVAIGTSVPTATLDVTGTTGYNQLRVRTAFTPVGTADSNGNTGDIAWDDDYVYVKTSTGWKRAALGTW